jgi:hypothetical protein
MSGDRRRDMNSDDRGISPVAGKTLELGIGVILIALITTSLLGGVTPGYQSAVGIEIADRVVINVADRIESTADGTADTLTADRRIRVTVPQNIRQKPYRVIANTTADKTHIRLQHPDPAISASTHIVSHNLITVTGSIRSETPSWIRLQAHTAISNNRSRSAIGSMGTITRMSMDLSPNENMNLDNKSRTNINTIQAVDMNGSSDSISGISNPMRMHSGDVINDILNTGTEEISSGDFVKITIILTNESDEIESTEINTTSNYMQIHS